MSFLPRPSRPRNSASPKRRPLHARSDSDTNELAGSAPNSQRNSKSDIDFVYSQSPFPRLPSQVLRPAGDSRVFDDSQPHPSSSPRAESPRVFEDTSATPPLNPPSRIPRWPPDAPRQPRSRSPRDKGKGRAKPAPTIDTALPQPPASPVSPPGSARRGRASPRMPERANSKVRSIVSAIEEASQRSDSVPPTPRPSSRPRQSPRQSPAARFSVQFSDEPVPQLPPLIPSIEEDDAAVASPVLDSEEPFTALPSSVPASAEPPSSPPPELPSSPPFVTEDSAPSLRPFQLMRSNETLRSEMSERSRSSSAPAGPTDELLQALIASGANVQYPRLEKPSLASMDTDTSSVRRALPQPLNLRRKQGRSQLARNRSVREEDEDDFVLEYDDRADAQARAPTTPPHQPRLELNPQNHWTPSRWTAELEDTVPELNPHALRAQHSFYGERESTESRPGSVCSIQSTSSAGFYRFLNDSKTAWAKSYYSGNGTLRNVTPPYLSTASLGRHSSSMRRRSYSASYSASLSGMSQSQSQSQESDEVPEPIFIPRRRPFLRKAVNASAPPDTSSSQDVQRPDSEPLSEPGQPEVVDYVDSPRRAHRQPRRLDEPQTPVWTHHHYDHYGPVPHLSPDRSANPRYSVMRPPSLDGYGWFTPVNVQLGLAILGLIFPFCWMIAACLRLPPKPEMPVADPESGQPEPTVEEQQAFLEDPEVKQYHKARFLRRVNRAMSFTGLCVIAAVIALAVIATH